MKLLALFLCITLISGCALPTTTVRSVDTRPSIAIIGAPDTAELLIDGLQMGKANSYNADPKVLTIEPGTHRISIVNGGRIIYDQNIFVESELKTIKLP